MRTLIRCILPALAAGVLATESLSAQELEQPRTHTVRRGDTLWDIARQYLGDPFLWPEIYRLNRDIVEDPHWIFPGEVLRLPGPEQVAEQPPVEPVEAPPQPPVDPRAPTVFTPRRAAAVVGTQVPTGIVGAVPSPTVRPGQVIAAPYVDREGGPRAFGRILKSGDLPGIAEASDRFRFQAYDRIFVAPPPGYVAAEGERYLAYRMGPTLDGLGQVVIPTGVIEITRAARSSVAAVAKVVLAFNELTANDRLLPLDTAGISTTVRPLGVADGPSTTVRWVYGEPVLPSLQSFIILGVTARQGVRMGDEFLIYQPQGRPARGSLADPEIPIGRVQVVRATPYAVTAVVVGQEQPAIKEGMSARVTARMP